MRESDFDEFKALWGAVSERYGKALSAMSLALDFQALGALSIAEVRVGLQAHMQHPTDCRFFPMPGQIIAYTTAGAAQDGRPGEEEAWSIALTGRDEAASVVWTTEIAEAWNVARMVMDLGDKVGARMAFKEAYGKALTAARSERRPMRWELSEGHDPVMRADALRIAASNGRHVAGVADMLALPKPREPVALLEGTVASDDVRAPTDSERAALQALRNMLASKSKAPSPDALARERTADASRGAAAAVETYAEAHGIDLRKPAPVAQGEVAA